MFSKLSKTIAQKSTLFGVGRYGTVSMVLIQNACDIDDSGCFTVCVY